jgi:hypothetical protein
LKVDLVKVVSKNLSNYCSSSSKREPAGGTSKSPTGSELPLVLNCHNVR